MSSESTRSFKAKYAGTCWGCGQAFLVGDKIVKIKDQKLLCEPCARHPKTHTAAFAGTCERKDCGARFRAGDIIGWSYLEGACCFHCLSGKDSAEAALSFRDLKRFKAAIEEVKKLRHLLCPSAEAKQRFNDSLEILRNDFAHLRVVQKLLKEI